MELRLTMNFEELKETEPEVAETTMIETGHPWYARGFPEKAIFEVTLPVRQIEAGGYEPQGSPHWRAWVPGPSPYLEVVAPPESVDPLGRLRWEETDQSQNLPTMGESEQARLDGMNPEAHASLIAELEIHGSAFPAWYFDQRTIGGVYAIVATDADGNPEAIWWGDEKMWTFNGTRCRACGGASDGEHDFCDRCQGTERAARAFGEDRMRIVED